MFVHKVILTCKKDYAKTHHLKPSYTAYMGWGKGPKRKLRFSKLGSEYLEKAYSTHYVVSRKAKKNQED